jgi:hypothetical protein
VSDVDLLCDHPSGSSTPTLALSASQLVHMGATEIMGAGSSVPVGGIGSPAVHRPGTRFQYGI